METAFEVTEENEGKEKRRGKKKKKVRGREEESWVVLNLPTWILWLSSKQSQSEPSLDVLVTVDRGADAGKDLKRTNTQY